MKSLKKIQQDFHQAIFQKNSNLDFIASSFPVERLAIYKNTIFENIRHALEITFPGVWSLLGADCANSIVHRFCFVENHLPSTGCLDDFGENFPSYLGSLDILSTLPYIQDYALFEWLKHLAYTATKSPAITPDDLQQIHEDLLAEIKMTFVPSCYLFSSRFPIQEIDERAFNPQASNMLLSEKNNSFSVDFI